MTRRGGTLRAMTNSPLNAAIAEAQGHHPDITFGWGYAEVVIFTHKIAGLHENDFILAAKVEALIDG